MVTNLADHPEGISHDRINRYLRGERLTLAYCGITSNLLQVSEDAYILFDTVLINGIYSGFEVARRSTVWCQRKAPPNRVNIVRGIGLKLRVRQWGNWGSFGS